jgi:hypothetical protein
MYMYFIYIWYLKLRVLGHGAEVTKILDAHVISGNRGCLGRLTPHVRKLYDAYPLRTGPNVRKK